MFNKDQRLSLFQTMLRLMAADPVCNDILEAAKASMNVLMDSSSKWVKDYKYSVLFACFVCFCFVVCSFGFLS